MYRQYTIFLGGCHSQLGDERAGLVKPIQAGVAGEKKQKILVVQTFPQSKVGPLPWLKPGTEESIKVHFNHVN